MRMFKSKHLIWCVFSPFKLKLALLSVYEAFEYQFKHTGHIFGCPLLSSATSMTQSSCNQRLHEH